MVKIEQKGTNLKIVKKKKLNRRNWKLDKIEKSAKIKIGLKKGTKLKSQLVKKLTQ